MIDQGELFSIPNPCRGICQVNNKGYCKGCLRSRDERFYWQEFTPFQRQLVINACEKRRRRILQAKREQETLVSNATDEAAEESQLSLLLLESENSLIKAHDADRVGASIESNRTTTPTTTRSTQAKTRASQIEPLEQPDLFSDPQQN